MKETPYHWRDRVTAFGEYINRKGTWNIGERYKRRARVAMKGAEPMSGELCAVVKLYRKYKPTARNFGDADNHLKAIFDGLSGIVFEDDSQICRCTVEKFTDKENPRAVIEIGAMQERNVTP